MTHDTDDQMTRLKRDGRVTIPQCIREEFGLEAGDELRWIRTEDGIKVRKVTGSAGRGMLVDESVPGAKREEMAEEMEEAIQAKQRNERSNK